jgi:hypothetical protein
MLAYINLEVGIQGSKITALNFQAYASLIKFRYVLKVAACLSPRDSECGLIAESMAIV